MSLGAFLGYLGIVLCLLSSMMKSMVPLRAVALIGNVVGMAFGYLDDVMPTLIGNLLLLPINGYRLWEIKKLVRDIETAAKDSPIGEWLLPHMKLRRVRAGTVLFRQGDIAEEMFYLQQGEICLAEDGKRLGPGTLFGEMGMFAADSRRLRTVRCETDCEIYFMTREQVDTLYFQNPKLAFFLIRMIVERLAPAASPPPPVVQGALASPARS